MATRTINVSLLMQRPGKSRIEFTPDLTSVDGDVLLKKVYVFTTDASGDVTIALPVKATGTIRYTYKLPTDQARYPSTGEFYLEAGSTIDLDDLITAGVVATDSVMEYVNETIGVFNITAYGAAVDGVTDDSAAVLAALDAAKAVGGGIIFFPAGTTRLSAESSFNPTANVQGQYVLQGQGSASKVLFKTVTGIPLYFQNCGSVTLRDLVFVGDSSSGSSTAVAESSTALIYFAYCWKAVIQRCFFLGIASSTSTYGIVSGGESSILIKDSLFAGCTTPNSGVVTIANNRNFELDNVTFIDLYEKFNNVTYSKLAGVGSMKHWVRVHTPIANTGYVRPSVIIKNCEFDENTTDVLLDLDGRVDMFYEMENCSLNSGISGSVAGMRIETFARASFRNIWAGYCPGANSSLIAKDIAQVEIDGYLHDAGATDIQLTGTTKRLRLRNAQDVTITNTANAFVDADQAMPETASASALAPKGRVTHVTGTTAVTSITATNFRAGDIITLIFDGILTFTHGNNIKLAGGANFTTAANSMIVLQYDGTDFFEVSRKA